MYTIRGATTVESDTKENVLNEVKILLKAIIDENDINILDIVSILFTATKDICSVYPAVCARELGITKASLMCMQEMYVAGSLEKCIRVMIMVDSNKKQLHARHIYLNKAGNLRPDIKNYNNFGKEV